MGEDPQPHAYRGWTGCPRWTGLAWILVWGLPPSAASRRDTEDMLARVSRSESESSEATRRIEEQLRSVARRLDSAERSQSENNRAMSKTASEINVATREQAQAFDQLGGLVMGLSDRIERLERSATQDGLKDAVKALHQGLSRLADQITQTASQSATQVSALTGNLEQVAGRVGQVRADVEKTTAALEQLGGRVTKLHHDVRNEIHGELDRTTQTLEQRLAAVEKAAQFNTNALDHALEKLEAQANIRAGDLAEAHKRETQSEVTVMRLEESLSRLEAKGRDPVLDRRLDGVDRALSDIAQRLDQQGEPLEDALRLLTRRIDTVEKNNHDLLVELRANLARPAAPEGNEPAIKSALPRPNRRRLLLPFRPSRRRRRRRLSKRRPLPNLLAAKSRPSAAMAMTPAPFRPASMPPILLPAASRPTISMALRPASPPGPRSADYAADPAMGENFLSAARRSAQAAAQAEAQRSTRSFPWSGNAQAAAPAARPRYLIPAVVVVLMLAALAAGLVLSRRTRAPVNPGPRRYPNPAAQPSVAPPTQTDTTVTLAPFLPAPQSTEPKRKVLPLTPHTVPPVRSGVRVRAYPAGTRRRPQPQATTPATRRPPPIPATASPSSPMRAIPSPKPFSASNSSTARACRPIRSRPANCWRAPPTRAMRWRNTGWAPCMSEARAPRPIRPRRRIGMRPPPTKATARRCTISPSPMPKAPAARKTWPKQPSGSPKPRRWGCRIPNSISRCCMSAAMACRKA